MTPKRIRIWAKAYQFLGSIHLAITLIGATALFVIAGTLLESHTESHRYAAHFTYGNPLFLALLWGFFVNILCSALRRYPFKLKHVPFLITHLGLLMILGGTLCKSYLGTQGVMGISEGSGSQQIFLADTYAIEVEKKNSPSVGYFALQRDLLGNLLAAVKPLAAGTKNQDLLSIALAEYVPHSNEHLAKWIKGNQAFVTGLAPMPVHTWEGGHSTHLPVSAKARLEKEPAEPWNFYAFRSEHVEQLARTLYLEGMQLHIVDSSTQLSLLNMPLRIALDAPFSIEGKEAQAYLNLAYTPLSGFQDPFLIIQIRSPWPNALQIPYAGGAESSTLFLEHAANLIQRTKAAQYVDTLKWSVQLKRTPAIAIIQDQHADDYLFAFDAHGRVHTEAFRADNLNSLIVYDKGFGGYAVQAHIPLAAGPLDAAASRETKEKAAANHFALECPITCQRSEEIPLKKLEDNLPKITLKLTEQREGRTYTEFVALTYDRFGKGLQWPALQGQYLLRFQPRFQTIPYRIRLRDARQINYPNSNQAYSYEADLGIKDTRDAANHTTEKTISMNNVHETWDGYRVYLANIMPAQETAVQSVQLVINHDPAKYFLTYPGGCLVALGIVLLFWLRPYSRKKEAKSK